MNKEVIIKAIKGQLEALVHEIDVLNGEYDALKIELKELQRSSTPEHKSNKPSKDIIKKALSWGRDHKIFKRRVMEALPHLDSSVVSATLIGLRNKGILTPIGRGERNSVVYILDFKKARKYLGIDE